MPCIKTSKALFTFAVVLATTGGILHVVATAPSDAAGSVRVLGSVASLPVTDLEQETLAARALMERRTGIGASSLSLKVRVCGSDAEYAAVGGPGNTDACFIPPDRIALRHAGRLRGTLAHEVTHALIRHASGSRCPGWLEEGIVNHETRVTPIGQYTPHTLARIERALDDVAFAGHPWSIADLRAGMVRSGVVSDAFYGAAWSATEYLYRVYGRDAVLRAVSRMDDRGRERAFRETFGRSSAELESDWRRAMEARRGARSLPRTPR